MPDKADFAKDIASLCVACLSLSWTTAGIGAVAIPVVGLAALGAKFWRQCPDRACKAAISDVLDGMAASDEVSDDLLKRTRKALQQIPKAATLDKDVLLSAAAERGELTENLVAQLTEALDPNDFAVKGLVKQALRAGFTACTSRPEFRDTLNDALIHRTLQEATELKEVLARVEETGQDTNQVVHRNQNTLDAILAHLQSSSRDVLVELAEKFGLEDPNSSTDAALIALLTEKSIQYHALKAEVEAINPAMRNLHNLKAAAQDALEQGDLEQVESLLTIVHGAELEEAAKSAELRANTALLKGDVPKAYRLLSSAADSFDAVDPKIPALLRLRYEDRLYQHGLRFGGKGMAFAERMIRECLEKVSKQHAPEIWASAQNSLAIALQDQGTRIGGAEGAQLLGDAVTAYRAALEVHTRAEHPAHWATTQNNLGNALRNQGTRTGGAEGAQLLGDAVTAYRAALEVRTRAEHPVHWAMTQNNLGNALQFQGTSIGGAEGAQLLGDAVTAYRAALEVRTRAEHPVDWAGTQNNLGNALSQQGIRTGGVEGAQLLGDAVTAYRAALEVRTRAEHPVDRAMTQNNLGNALKEQGIRIGGAEGAQLLGNAVTAYRAALEVYTRAEHPVHWAVTQNNLGNALQQQGFRIGGADGAQLLVDAVTAYRAALEVYTRAEHPVDWAMTQFNFAEVRRDQAALSSPQEKPDLLQSAMGHIEQALEVFDAATMPAYHARAEEMKASVQAALDALPNPPSPGA